MDRDTRTTYDMLGRVLRVSDERSRMDYGYDAVGNRTVIRGMYYQGLRAEQATSVTHHYQFDRENRMTLAKGILQSDGSFAPDQGVWLAYDAAGNRASSRQTEDGVEVTRGYSYDPGNRILESTYRTASIAERLTSVRTYDELGRVVDYTDYGATGAGGSQTQRQQTDYNANGWIEQQKHYNHLNTHVATVLYGDHDNTGPGSNRYDTAGNLRQYQVRGETGNLYTQTFTYQYVRIGGSYREGVISASGAANQGSFTPGTTTHRYDSNGHLVQIQGSGGDTTDRRFINSQGGQVLRKTEGEVAVYYAYAADQPIGAFSTDPNVAPDIDYNYTPVSSSYPATSPSLYVVQYGDTLQQIALNVYGDANLWYLIADANALTQAGHDLIQNAGISLRIPNRITNLRNAADTFQPYNPGEVIGDTRPELTFQAPPPPKRKCKTLARIVQVVVTLVVAAVASPLVGPQAGAAMGAYAGNMAGQITDLAANGELNWGKFLLLAPFSPHLAAEVASDGKFSTNRLLIDTTAAYVGGEVFGRLAPPGSTQLVQTGAAMTGAMAGNVTAQGMGMALKEQSSFSWNAVAASAVRASISGSPQAIGGGLMDSILGNIAGQYTQILLDGHGKIDWRSVAIDAFGNVLGNYIVGAMPPRSGAIPAEVQALGKEGAETYQLAVANGMDEYTATMVAQEAAGLPSTASTVAGGATPGADGTRASRSKLPNHDGQAYVYPDTAVMPSLPSWLPEGATNIRVNQQGYVTGYTDPDGFMNLTVYGDESSAQGGSTNASVLGIDAASVDADIAAGRTSGWDAAGYAARYTGYQVWNFLTAGFVKRHDERLSNPRLQGADFWRAAGLDAAGSVGSLLLGGRVGGYVAGRLGNSVLGYAGAGAAGGAAFDLTQQVTGLGINAVTDGQAGQDAFSWQQLAVTTAGGAALGGAFGLASRSPMMNVPYAPQFPLRYEPQMVLNSIGSLNGLKLQGVMTRVPLQAGDAGRFANLEYRAVTGDGLTPHHMPQAAAGFTSRADGGALMLPEAQHLLTRTYGYKGALTAQQEAGLSFRKVLARDIRDVRNIAGSRYNEGLQKLTRYYRENFPELMGKRSEK